MSFSSSDSDKDLAIKARPFIKWAGGKAQLLAQLRQRLPSKYGRYYEPFIGGGALFFDLSPQSAYISDVNQELVNCYQIVRDSTEELISELKTFRNEKEFYYEIRNLDRSLEFGNWTTARRAARLIYLNRTCFNGLYRVNSKGQFNVPFGNYKNPAIVSPANLYACSQALMGTEINCASFLEIEARVSNGDFVYFDPPYAPLSETSNFTSYAKDAFGEEQQVQLRDLCRRLNDKGVLWMLSNSSASLIKGLYENFNISVVSARRNINASGQGRGNVDELIIRNYTN